MNSGIQLLIGLVAGGGLTLLGMVVGRFHKGTNKPKDLEARCTCKHMLSDHDPQSNECHGKDLYKNHRDAQGYWLGNQLVPCTCRQYVGPRPFNPDIFLPELPSSDKDS